VLQIEQSIKLCRFLACTAAGAAASAASSGSVLTAAPAVDDLKGKLKSAVDAAVNFILESLPGLNLIEDKAVALAEAAQVGGAGQGAGVVVGQQQQMQQ